MLKHFNVILDAAVLIRHPSVFVQFALQPCDADPTLLLRPEERANPCCLLASGKNILKKQPTVGKPFKASMFYFVVSLQI